MTISILGCGWLGEPLGVHLLKAGHSINGSTTTPSKIELLKGKGITPFLLDLNPALECSHCEAFWDADLLVLNVPPGRGKENLEDYHLSQIKAVADRLNDSAIERVVFISSTSVYPKKPGIVNENDTQAGKAKRTSGNALLKAESLLMSRDAFETTVLRFGGLYGYDRHPAKFLAGRSDIKNGSAPVNLIHRDDCVNIITQIIDQEVEGEIFNAVSDGHPPRKMYYPAAAREEDLQPPTFVEDDSESDYKVVSNRKLKKQLDYSFVYPNPMDQLQMVET